MFISAVTAAHLAPISLSALRSLLPGQLSFGGEWPLAPRPRRADAQPRRRIGRPRREASVQQHALPLDKRDAIITPLMAEIERILARIADVGGEMPNNPVLGERAGGRGRSSIDRALRRLDAAGRIRLEMIPGRRRAYIVSCGSYTDWGEARPGHKPFCSRAKGAPPLPPKPRQPESLPLPPSAKTLAPLASLAGFDWTPPEVSLAAAARCQWPMWADGEAPNDQFCSAKVTGAPGCSWCADHRAAVYLPKRQRVSPGACPRA